MRTVQLKLKQASAVLETRPKNCRTPCSVWRPEAEAARGPICLRTGSTNRANGFGAFRAVGSGTGAVTSARLAEIRFQFAPRVPTREGCSMHLIPRGSQGPFLWATTKYGPENLW